MPITFSDITDITDITDKNIPGILYFQKKTKGEEYLIPIWSLVWRPSRQLTIPINNLIPVAESTRRKKIQQF